MRISGVSMKAERINRMQGIGEGHGCADSIKALRTYGLNTDQLKKEKFELALETFGAEKLCQMITESSWKFGFYQVLDSILADNFQGKK